MVKVSNEFIRGTMKVAPVTEKIKRHRLSCYGRTLDETGRKSRDKMSDEHECKWVEGKRKGEEEMDRLCKGRYA